MRRRIAALAFPLLLTACKVAPTPGLIDNCRTAAAVEASPAPKTRSIFLDSASLHGLCFACVDLLSEWQLDFVELRSLESPGMVDRVRLLPRGDRGCSATGDRDRQPRPLIDLYLSVPRRSCLAVERAPAPAAAVRLSVVREPAGDHMMELYEAAPTGGGTPWIRVRDFTIRAADAAPARCAGIVRGFPKDAISFILRRIAERR